MARQDSLEGDVVISVAGVTLQNTTININLLLAGIGEGDASLQNVTIQGETIVQAAAAVS